MSNSTVPLDEVGPPVFMNTDNFLASSYRSPRAVPIIPVLESMEDTSAFCVWLRSILAFVRGSELEYILRDNDPVSLPFCDPSLTQREVYACQHIVTSLSKS
eukprot:Ihof_evm8s125 gene=Ihof_evmTU8s125